MRDVLKAFLIVAALLMIAAGTSQLIVTDNSLTGNGSTANPLKVVTTVMQSRVSGTCTSPNAIDQVNQDGTVTCSTGVVDTAGLDLTKTGSTLAVDETLAQHRVSGTCTSPNSITQINQNGTVSCSTGVLNTSNVSGTTNKVAKFTAANTVGDSSITDDGTTVSTAENAVIGGTETVSGLSTLLQIKLTQAGDTYLYDSLSTSSGNQGLNINAAGAGAVRFQSGHGGFTNAGTGGLELDGGGSSTTSVWSVSNTGASMQHGSMTVSTGSSGVGSLVSTSIAEIEAADEVSMTIASPTNAYKAIFFANPSSVADGGILYDDNPNGFARGFEFRTGGNSNRMTIDSAGTVSILANTALNTSSGVTTVTGHGDSTGDFQATDSTTISGAGTGNTIAYVNRTGQSTRSDTLGTPTINDGIHVAISSTAGGTCADAGEGGSPIEGGCGVDNRAIYSTASGGDFAYSGYFDAGKFRVNGAAKFTGGLDVAVTGDLTVDSQITTSSNGVLVLNPNGLGTIEMDKDVSALGALTVTGLSTFTGGIASTAATNTVGNLTYSFESFSNGTGTVNNVAISATKTGALWTCGAPTTITGLAEPSGGVAQVYTIVAVSGTCKLAHQNASSSANNRIIIGAALDFTINAGDVVQLVYDPTALRWRLLGFRTPPSLSIENGVTIKWTVDNNGHLHTTGTAPTLSGCGTTPAITGGDSGFVVTTGTGATACTITFGNAYATNAPSCTVTPDGGAALPNITRSTTALTFTTAAASTKYSVQCVAIN